VGGDERETRLEAAASLFESAADELELAGAHARMAAEHFRGGDVPRATSHAWAAFGHLRTSEERLLAQARVHRQPASS
jgi:hypothetical protein